MSMAWIRKYYGVPAKRGMRVKYTGEATPEFGTIRSASNGRVNIQIDGIRHVLPFHPTWELEYEPQGDPRSLPAEGPAR